MPATLITATFLVTAAGTSIAPFLLDLARELRTDLAALGTLVAFSSVSWGVASLAAGAASDRVGRRPVLVLGLLVMSGSRIGLGLSASYGAAAVWQAMGGVGGGIFTGTVFATVSDQVASAQRGRALGGVITGQSLALVLGVPLVTLVGSLGGWRGALLVQGATLLLSALAVFGVVPAAARSGPREGTAAPSLVSVLRPRLLTLLGASTMERACFAGVSVYLPTYLVVSYGISLAMLAPVLGLVALGNLVGSVGGGQLADRGPAHPLTFAVASAMTAILAWPLLFIQPGLAFSVVVGFAYSLTNAVGRPPLLAALSDVPRDVRGAVLGLNVTTASVGWLGATALGGWLISGYGFAGLGLFSAGAAALGSVLAVIAASLPAPARER